MDENTQIQKYMESLPKPVQEVVFNSPWEERVYEIGKKYSLADSQSDNLTNIVLLTLIGIEKPETFLDGCIRQLGISRLLAEQLVADLELRVFEPSLRIVEKMQSKNSILETKSEVSNPKIPEIKPDNLPAVEIGKENKPYSPVKNDELVQKPYGVPRFGMKTLEPKVSVINLSQNKPENSQSMMENKMNKITTNIPMDMQKKDVPSSSAPVPPQIPPTKYSSDPYREPLL